MARASRPVLVPGALQVSPEPPVLREGYLQPPQAWAVEQHLSAWAEQPHRPQRWEPQGQQERAASRQTRRLQRAPSAFQSSQVAVLPDVPGAAEWAALPQVQEFAARQAEASPQNRQAYLGLQRTPARAAVWFLQSFNRGGAVIRTKECFRRPLIRFNT